VRLSSSHIAQMNGMRNNGVAHSSELNIFYTILFAGFFNYFADGRVVDM
jgi:hypothetical protein